MSPIETTLVGSMPRGEELTPLLRALSEGARIASERLWARTLERKTAE